MDGVIYSIFFFILIPLIYAAFFMDNKSKPAFICLIVGMVICLVSSEINALLLDFCDGDFFYLSTTISPMVEETMKGLPLIFLIFVWLDKNKKLVETSASCGMALGVGFALFENIVSFFQNNGSVSLLWSLARGFGSGLVHGVCTALVGVGIALIRKEKSTYFFSILGLFTATFIYHGLYNCFVQTEEYQLFGIIMPTVSYTVFIVFYKQNKFFRTLIKNLTGDRKVNIDR